MEVKCRLNGENITLHGEPTARLRDVLYHTGCYSVRDSDDAEGFAGSDTIIFNGKLRYANFILLRILKNGLTSYDVFEACIRQGMMIRDCSSFQCLDGEFVRFCIMMPEDNSRLVKVLKSL